MRKLGGMLRISSFWFAGLSLVACAPFFDNGAWRTMSGARIVQPDLRQSIGYYESAVAAINGRHYALALEYLQAAREQKPDDVRVLTAFGVVYDKLGRFDLSARYYAQAASLDPKSRIIAADLDYSRRLQGILAPDAGVTGSVASASPGIGGMQVTPRQLAAGNRDPIRGKADVHPAARPVFLTGHPLVIVDASGRGGADKSVRSYLSGLGWSVAKDGGVKGQIQSQTRIVYRETMATAAKALARTLSLPFAVHLTASNDVEGLQLILGGDVSGKIMAGKSLQTPPRQLASAAAKSKSRE